jgi:hypothetical protein
MRGTLRSISYREGEASSCGRITVSEIHAKAAVVADCQGAPRRLALSERVSNTARRLSAGGTCHTGPKITKSVAKCESLIGYLATGRSPGCLRVRWGDR